MAKFYKSFALEKFNLTYSSLISNLAVLSETDFIYMQSMSVSSGGYSISSSNGIDLSIARINTNLEVIYNLMLDYGNLFDYSVKIITGKHNIGYFLSFEFTEGYILGMLPSNQSQIDVNQVIQNSLELIPPDFVNVQDMFLCTIFANLDNNQDELNELLVIIGQIHSYTYEIIYYNVGFDGQGQISNSSYYLKSIFINIIGKF